MTPLLIALLFLEITDIIFAAVDKFHLLKYGLALVLISVGLKMVWLNDLFGGKFPISLSLGIIGGIIAVATALSLLFPKAKPKTAGTLAEIKAGS